VCIDHTNVNLDRLRSRLDEVKECIYSLDLFESSYLEEYTEITKQIKLLVTRRTEIENKVNGIPSYMYADLIK
jgi:predicted nuclease with TOPRIM domain